MAIAIIPARAGSKGIPGKNTRPICGLPLYAWSALQAGQSSRIDRTIITTDIPEILDMKHHFGADVFRRSPETATDDATTESAMIEAVLGLGLQNEVVVLLQATSPCRVPGDIDRAVDRLMAGDCDSVFSACQIEGYVWQAHNVDGGATDILSAQRERRQPRQKRRVSNLEENGSIYACHARNLVQTGDRLHGRIVPVLQNRLCGFQLDSDEDYGILEICMRGLHFAD